MLLQRLKDYSSSLFLCLCMYSRVPALFMRWLFLSLCMRSMVFGWINANADASIHSTFDVFAELWKSNMHIVLGFQIKMCSKLLSRHTFLCFCYVINSKQWSYCFAWLLQLRSRYDFLVRWFIHATKAKANWIILGKRSLQNHNIIKQQHSSPSISSP